MKKEFLRTQILKQRNQLSKQEWQERSHAIHQQLIRTKIWQDAEHVALYASFQSEVDTYFLLKKGIEQEKAIYLPKSNVKEKKMTFYKIDHLNQLQTGPYGIQEPLEHPQSLMDPNQLQLILCPGLVFDRRGERIGYGGGFYDRFLEQYQHTKLNICAMAFSFQLVDEVLLLDQHDIRMDWIITENEIIYAKAARREKNI